MFLPIIEKTLITQVHIKNVLNINEKKVSRRQRWDLKWEFVSLAVRQQHFLGVKVLGGTWLWPDVTGD